MKHAMVAIGAVAAGLIAAVMPVRAQQAPWVFRDFAMEGGNYYLRALEFVEASKATFLKDGDHVIGVTGEGVSKAYLARAVTWHHGIEDRVGRLPVFVTW